MSRTKKLGLAVLVSALAVTAIVATGGGKAGDLLERLISDHAYARDLGAIAEKLASDGANPREQVQRSLAFVAGNSIHRIDDWHDEHAWNTAYVLHLMRSHFEGGSGFRPHLSCGPRTIAMQRILDELGITSRRVQIYSDDFDSVRGHRFLEVFMEDRQAWEIWDPDYNIVWRDEETGTLASVTDLLLEREQRAVPVPASSVDGKFADPGKIAAHYFEAALFESNETGMTDAVIVYDPARFDPNVPFRSPGGVTFDAWARQHYGAPRLVPLAPSDRSKNTAGVAPRAPIGAASPRP